MIMQVSLGLPPLSESAPDNKSRLDWAQLFALSSRIARSKHPISFFSRDWQPRTTAQDHDPFSHVLVTPEPVRRGLTK
jgi:hypothetical protein